MRSIGPNIWGGHHRYDPPIRGWMVCSVNGILSVASSDKPVRLLAMGDQEHWFYKEGHALAYLHWRKAWLKQTNRWGKLKGSLAWPRRKL